MHINNARWIPWLKRMPERMVVVLFGNLAINYLQSYLLRDVAGILHGMKNYTAAYASVLLL